MSEVKFRSDKWIDEEEAADVRPLTRQEAQAFRERHPQVSAWWVIAAQAALGGVLAILAWWIYEDRVVLASALYGAGVVVLPGALMAHAATRRNSGVSPLVGAVGFMSWTVVKMGCSVLMLLLAPKVVPGLNWPALLLTMVLCMQVYWLALLWRRPRAESIRKSETGPRTHGN